MKKQKRIPKYFLVPTDIVVKEGGISMYSLLKEGDFSRDLTQKYHNDVKDILNLRLEKISREYGVPTKEIDRIKGLIKELIQANEILVTYDCNDAGINGIIKG